MKKEQVRDFALSLLDDKCGIGVEAYRFLCLLLNEHKIYDIQGMAQRQVFHVVDLDLDEDRFVIESDEEENEDEEEYDEDDDEEEDNYCDETIYDDEENDDDEDEECTCEDGECEAEAGA